jgi:hypothetical protein
MNTSCLQQDDYDPAFKAFETKYKGLARVLLFSLIKETATTTED